MAPLMNLDEAAAVLHLSTRQVRRLVAERRIAHRRLGRSVRFSTQDLTDYIEASRVVPMSALDVRRALRKVA